MKTLYVYVAKDTPCEEALNALANTAAKSQCLRPDMGATTVEYTITTDSESLVRMLHALAGKGTWEIPDERYELKAGPRTFYVYFGMGSMSVGLAYAHTHLLGTAAVNHCAEFECTQRPDLGPGVAQYKITEPDSWLSTILMNLKQDPTWQIFEGRLNTI